MDQARKAVDTPSPHLAWPIGVQIALAFLITAGLFFLLGRWSYGGAIDSAARRTTTDQPRAGLNLNLATKAELRLIPGIGEALAQRIVDHRDRNGPFRNIDELRKIAGIGPKTFERIRYQLFVTPEEPSYVSTDDEEMPATEMKSTPRMVSVSKKASELTSPIDVNRASQTDLQKLPGIGPKLSQHILETRAKAAFKSVDDLRRVPGIGVKTLEKLRPHVTVGGG